MKLLEIRNLKINIKKNNSRYKKLENVSFSINSGDVILLTGSNGSGKSSIIKVIIGDLFDFYGLEFSGQIISYLSGDSLIVNENDINRSKFAEDVCYISQNDDVAFVEVIDCFRAAIDKEKTIVNKDEYIFNFIYINELYKAFFTEEDELFDSKSIKFLKSIGINNSNQEQLKTAKFLLSKTRNMSGGQAKLLNITSNLIRYEFCKLCLIDEPLNNLDYSNVRLLSNLLCTIHKKRPELAFLIVTHCRAITIVNRILQIDTNTKQIIEIKDVEKALPSGCNSCFGVVEKGYYI